MAKHRMDKPNSSLKAATTAVVAGSIALGGTLALAGATADAAKIKVPNVGTFDVPDHLVPKDLPKQFQPDASGSSLPNFGLKKDSRESRALKAVRAAESKIGSPYVYGAAGPNAFDCSGLTSWAYKQAGKIIPRDSYGQMGGGTAVAGMANARPGDILIFNGGGHAGIYEGNGTFIHSSTEGVPVQRSKVKAWNLVAIRRY